jgi:hypothetical protein
MNNKFFLVNVFNIVSALTRKTIADQLINIDTSIKTAYSKNIENLDSYNSISLFNNESIRGFYDNIIVNSSSIINPNAKNSFLEKGIKEIKSEISNLYISCNYRNPSQKDCVSLNTDGTINFDDISVVSKIYNINSASVDVLALGDPLISSYTDQTKSARPYTEVRECEGIIVSKSYVNINGVIKEVYPWDSDNSLSSSSTNKIVTSFYKCKVYFFVVKNYETSSESFSYATYPLIFKYSSIEYQYSQNFDEVSEIQAAQNIQLSKIFYPFCLLLNNNAVTKGSLMDAALPEAYLNFPELCTTDAGYFNTDNSAFSLQTNTMACDLGGNLMLQYNSGKVVKVRDDQLCGAQTGNSFIKVNNVIDEFSPIYNQLTGVSGVVDIYANNFSYIKYVKNDSSLELITGDASIKNQTQLYSGLQLQMQNYFSYQYDERYEDSAFLFTYAFRAESGAVNTDFYLDVKPEVKRPRIRIQNIPSQNTIIVSSDYATEMIHSFNNESSIKTGVTDTANGVNQISYISTSGKFGTLHIEARNYFYSFDNESRDLYSASDSVQVSNSPTISDFKLELLRGGVISNFYDSSDSSVAGISGELFNQDGFDNYRYYNLYTDNSSIGFKLSYSYAYPISLRIGSSDSRVVSSGSNVTFSKQDLFSALSKDGQINISSILPDGTEFNAPFVFKDSYNLAPVLANVQINKVILNNAEEATLTFSFDYQYSEAIRYEILNQNDAVIYSEPLKIEFSSSIISYSIQTDIVQIENIDSLKVRVTLKNTSNTSGVESNNTAVSTSSVYLLPLRLPRENASSVRFFSDSALATETFSMTKNKTIYVKLQLFDKNGTEINESDYFKYINTDPNSLQFTFGNPENLNDYQRGITFNRVSSYVYSLFISSDTSFKKNDASIKVKYTPIYEYKN